MARLQYLALILALCIPAFLPNTALADQTPPVTFASGGVSYGSMADMCQAAATGAATASGKTSLGYDYCNYNAVYQGNSQRKVAANYKYQSGANVVVSGLFDAGWGYQPCPSGSSYISGSVPTVVCSGSAPPPCVKDQSQSYSSPNATGSDQCVSGCVVALDGGRCGFNAAGAQMCFYDGHQTGASCTTGTATGGTATNDPAYDCAKQGKSWGSVNGSTVCVSAGTTGTPPVKTVNTGKSTTTTAADGTKTTTTDSPSVTTTTGAASGSAAGTPPKITEETTNPDGTASSVTENADKFCEKNPNNAICKKLDKSSFSSGCANGVSSVTCDGDSIQCAIAKAQADNRCADLKTDTVNELGERLITGTSTAGDLGGTDTFTTPHVVDIGSLDTTSVLPKGCLPDQAFTLGGHSIVLPLSRLCDGLQTAGKIVLAFAYMLAARIIFS